ncbi:unnamed protein product [Strongylus vulgaris]|uniref:Uncharacterized protein n=1 Tax=Strongylus vulgaris TaxID=40348 RepID=A0A3P7JPE2_STRVU|nr:unnamed protein product [Strongylus vulgaris]
MAGLEHADDDAVDVPNLETSPECDFVSTITSRIQEVLALSPFVVIEKSLCLRLLKALSISSVNMRCSCLRP